MPSLIEIKEAKQCPTPLMLFECALWGGDIERWCTHAVEYEGETYAACVLDHSFQGFEAGADGGLDTAASLTVTLANADGFFGTATQSDQWRGARVRVMFVFWDLKTGGAVTTARTVFRGLANAPEVCDDRTVRVSFVSMLNASRLYLPEVRLQRDCPWQFPINAAEREEAANGGERGKHSALYRCGYSPDVEGGRGNLSEGAAYVTCDYTATSCRSRGMFDRDEEGRTTRRFGGFEYVPPAVYVREHGDKAYRLSEPLTATGRYNDYLPLVYGTGWMAAPVVTARNDGNLLRMEVVVSIGEVEGVRRVMVNGMEVPEGEPGADMTASGWYNWVSKGTREGAFNLDLGSEEGAPVGDPHGSLAVLSVVAPRSMASGRTAPEVRVLVDGLKLRTYATDGEYLGEAFSNNPAWALLDVLMRGGWKASDIELGSFAAAAVYCGEAIEVQDRQGENFEVERYRCNMVVRNRRSLADVARGVRTGAGLRFCHDDEGRLQLRAESTLAVQHATSAEGSNALEALSGGWPVYEFGDGTEGRSGILMRADGSSSLRFYRKAMAETANRMAVEYLDEFADYRQDGVSVLDMEDYKRRGHEVTQTLPALGIPNTHQAVRVLRKTLDRGLAGNTYAEFDTSFRAVGIQPGDIITLSSAQDGYSRQPFRVIKISPQVNYRSVRILTQLHDDAWYSDAVNIRIGEHAPAADGGEGVRIPRPILGKVADEYGNLQFETEERAYETESGTPVIELTVGFTAPCRPGEFGLETPRIEKGASPALGEGSLTGPQAMYYGVTAVVEDKESRISPLARVLIPSSTEGSGVRLSGLRFPSEATHFHVYRGKTPMGLLRVAAGVTVTDTYVDSGSDAEAQGPPDENYDHAVMRWRVELTPAVSATEYGPGAIGSSMLQLSEGEMAGSVARIIGGKGRGQERTVRWNTATRVEVGQRWTIEPDSTSTFVICEGTWQEGTRASSSPATIRFPNRPGTYVEILGTSANAAAEESPAETGIRSRWRLQGTAADYMDRDMPPAPVFGLSTPGDGGIEVAGISFPTLENTRTISAGTLSIYYWDELGGTAQSSLAAAVSEAETAVAINGSTGWGVGDLLQIGREIAVIEEVAGAGGNYTVTRGSYGSTATAQAEGTPVRKLARRITIIPFPKDFFGSPVSGHHNHSLVLPGARVACAAMHVTNSFGNGEAAKVCFTNTVDKGLRTHFGGQVNFQVEGGLAIQTRATPAFTMDRAYSVRDVFGQMQEAPVGGAVGIRLRLNGEPYCELSIAAGETVSGTVSGSELAPLPELGRLDLDILSVPQGGETTSGRDLTVTVRL